MSGILSIQLKPVIADKKANLAKIETFIEQNKDKKPDLVVIPEFFSTGIHHESFLSVPEDETGGETIKFISGLAKKYNTNIVAGSVIEKYEGKLYNTSFAINRKGKTIGKYRKIHLYNYLGGAEGKNITPGNEIKAVDFDFARVGITICFDLRYPMLFKELAKLHAQIIVLPTAWIVSNDIYNDKGALSFAKDTFLAMSRIRAYDKGIYFISSNQIGKVNDNVSAIGCSSIIAPTSQVLALCADEECAIWSDVDIESIESFKKIFPIAEID